MANEQDTARMIAFLSASFPAFAPTADTVRAYHAVLNHLPTDLLQAATVRAASKPGQRFAPSFGEILEAAGELSAVAAGVPDVYSAWQEVQRQIVENGGDYGRPVWSNPLVEQAVRAIGWRNLRMSENQVADRARFVEAYSALVKRSTRDTMEPPAVRGYLEARTAGQITAQVSELTARLTSPTARRE